VHGGAPNPACGPRWSVADIRAAAPRIADGPADGSGTRRLVSLRPAV